MQHAQAQPTSNTRNRGFASMNAERQREIARKGGRAAHEKGTAHEFSSDEARAAGRKGGERVSADRSHMSRIGRLGGKSSAGRRQTDRSEGELPGTMDSRRNHEDGNGQRDAMAEQPGEMAAAESNE